MAFIHRNFFDCNIPFGIQGEYYMKWFDNAVFYALPTLQALGAEDRNDFTSLARHRLRRLVDLLPHIRDLGCTAINLGPVNESSSHGYDTVDHFHVDRRLGNNESFRETVQAIHDADLKVIVDTVFNHTGRDHWAFYDLRCKKRESQYGHWFSDVDFSKNNSFNDGFSYRNWEGYNELVTLNRKNPAVRNHLLSHIRQLIQDHGVDGVRLDVAYCLESDFLAELADSAKKEREDFYIMGEIIHGNYNRLLLEGHLDSVTNYEASKGLWSSLNDANYYEIDWTFEREFGSQGLCKGKNLYNFVDNHDVNRVYSLLKNKRHISLVYAMLFFMPGTPSLYYGSEFLAEGMRDSYSDRALRPFWDDIPKRSDNLLSFLATLSRCRRERPFLGKARYHRRHIENTLFSYTLEDDEGHQLLACFNQAEHSRHLTLHGLIDGQYRNILATEEVFHRHDDGSHHITLDACSFKILEPL